MKRTILIIAMLIAVTAVPVFAATTAQEQSQNDWYNQMYQYHQQMMQRFVDSGTFTQEQADLMNQNMQQMTPYMQQMMQSGGAGMMRNGGMMGNGSMMGNLNQSK